MARRKRIVVKRTGYQTYYYRHPETGALRSTGSSDRKTAIEYANAQYAAYEGGQMREVTKGLNPGGKSAPPPSTAPSGTSTVTDQGSSEPFDPLQAVGGSKADPPAAAGDQAERPEPITPDGVMSADEIETNARQLAETCTGVGEPIIDLISDMVIRRELAPLPAQMRKALENALMPQCRLWAREGIGQDQILAMAIFSAVIYKWREGKPRPKEPKKTPNGVGDHPNPPTP